MKNLSLLNFFGQRLPLIIIFILASCVFLYMKESALSGSSLAVALALGKDYGESVSKLKLNQ